MNYTPRLLIHFPVTLDDVYLRQKNFSRAMICYKSILIVGNQGINQDIAHFRNMLKIKLLIISCPMIRSQNFHNNWSIIMLRKPSNSLVPTANPLNLHLIKWCLETKFYSLMNHIFKNIFKKICKNYTDTTLDKILKISLNLRRNEFK